MRAIAGRRIVTGHGSSWRRNWDPVLLLLLAAMLCMPSAAMAGGRSDGPLTLQLIAEQEQTGILRYAADRHYVSGPASDARIESAVTGFELSFVGSIPSPGQVHVALHLTLTVPDSPPPGGTNGVRELSVVTSFDAADGDTLFIPETPDGPAIAATPRIVAGGTRAPAVLLQVEIPVGGQLLSLGAQKLLRNIRLVGTHGSDNSFRQATGHSFLTGVSAGEAVLSSAESGTGLKAGISTDGATTIGLNIEVDCDFVDEPVATRTVRIDGLMQKLQLPVARSLTVETAADFAPGQTMALAGVKTGDPDGAEIIVLATPRLIDGAPLPQALVEAQVALVSGDANPVEGTTERTQKQKSYTTAAAEPKSGALLQSAEQAFVVGYPDDAPARLLLKSSTSLQFRPTTLAPGELQLDVNLTSVGFAPASPQFPLVTLKGEKLVDLPQTQVLKLDSHVAVHDGETIAIAGALSNLDFAGSSQKLESLFFGTAKLGADGSVRFDGRLVETAKQTTMSKKDQHDTVHTVKEQLQCLESAPSP
ncbi:MAG: hypothetical protein ACU83V_12580 [Gammaproteobacteria bacterium]